ncbi:acetate kinase [Phormidesmis priestleyi]
MKILVLNAGSSSQKSCLYEITEDTLPDHFLQLIWEAKVDWTHQQNVVELKVKTQGAILKEELEAMERSSIITHMLNTLWNGETQVIEKPSDVDGVGHRVVHGGEKYRQSVQITPEVKDAIAELSIFAPIHNPINLEGIEAIATVFGEVPQVAVFDTAFHAQLPLAATVYPIPYQWFEKGIRRYGFHGISHRYCADRAAQILERDLQELRLVTCHLGNGCSLAAIQNGHSIDTTMGFTPLEGLMMGSRSGSVDPGILIHLLRQEGFSADQLDEMLNKSSGLKGVSGVSADLRQILAAISENNAQAKLAFDVYIHRLRAQIGAMAASLKGLDVLVFTAGVGENSPEVRAAACEGFEFLGLRIDPEKNANSPKDQDISMPDSTIRVLVIQTQEDWAIAQECWQILR